MIENKNLPQEVPFTFFDGKSHQKLDAKKFTDLTGAIYVDANCIEPKVLLDDWNREPCNNMQSLIKEKFT